MTTRATRPTLKRRWQRLVLRTQGRLDGEAADRLLPWGFAFVLFSWFLALDAAAERSLDGGSGLGPWLQAVWSRQQGGVATPVAGVDPARGTWSLLSEAVLWSARFVHPEAVFAIIQAGALALGVVPLWRLARDEARLRVGATSVVVAAFALAPTLHRTNLTAFHPEAVALPLLLWAYLQACRGHWKRYAALVVLVLACGAPLGLSVVGLGLVLFLTGEQRPGMITGAVGLLWTVVAAVVIDAEIPAGGLTPAGEFVARATGPLAVAPLLIRQPVDQVGEFLSEPAVFFLVLVLAPLLFLPLLRPRRLSGALPYLALAMIADSAVQGAAGRGVLNSSLAGAHIAPAMAFVFLALIYALERIGQPSVSRVNVDRRVLMALLAGSSLFFLIEAPSSPYEQPWAWGSRDALDGARLEAADLIPDESAVAVSPSCTSLVAARAAVTELPLDAANLRASVVRSTSSDATWILLDTTGTDPETGRSYWHEPDVIRVLAGYEDLGYEVGYDAEGIYLLVPEGQD